MSHIKHTYGVYSLRMLFGHVADQASISNVQLAGMSPGHSRGLDQWEAEEGQSICFLMDQAFMSDLQLMLVNL